ncbi:NAD-dependent epimerase/dehydratase family protein [Symbiobacterium thermophilum]|uniref:NAD-dependent epimerase/dehydratase family protein n=1 Tax=Symbiobacterium thermophilum TaxID=2734 RepID=UPI0035C7816C
MSRRALITGVTGVLGRELAGCLRRRGYAVYGAARRPLEGWQDGLDWLPIECDVTDDASVLRAIRLSRPELIFHLAAAQASATRSPSVDRLFAVNVGGTLRLLTAAAEAAPGARVIVASTGAVYGPNTGPRHRWREDAPLRPPSPYAASKAAMELAARGAAAGLGVEVVVARLFNLIGVSPGADSAPAGFARQIAAMAAAGRPRPLRTRNLDAVRDYLDSRDAARALTLLGELPDPDPVYNVCSGRGVRLRWVARQLWRLGGAGAPFLAEGDIGTAKLPGGAGSHPPDRLVGDPGRIRAATGWAPEVPLTRSLERLLAYWQTRATAGREEERP